MRRFFLPMAFISSMLFPQQSGRGRDPELAPAPPTKEESVTDDYFGTTVRDDYRPCSEEYQIPCDSATAGLNDGRVAPYNSFKFAALLQAAAAPGNPILLTVNSFGHGIGSSLDQQVADITDVLSFFAYELSNPK